MRVTINPLWRSAALVGAVAAVLVLATWTAQAQTPSPPTPPPPGQQGSICAAASYVGGQTVRMGGLEITLPPQGTYAVAPISVDHGGSRISVCYVEGNSAIHFNPATGAEVSRIVNDSAVNSVLDDIARSVRVVESLHP